MIGARLTLCLVACALVSCTRSAPLPDRAPRVDEAVAHVLASGAGAIYMRIINDGPADVLRSVESQTAADAQLHEVVEEGELSTMRAAPNGFEVPAASTLVLAHGGKHVMLFGVKDARSVQLLELKLHFQRAGVVTVAVPVRHGVELGDTRR